MDTVDKNLLTEDEKKQMGVASIPNGTVENPNYQPDDLPINTTGPATDDPIDTPEPIGPSATPEETPIPENTADLIGKSSPVATVNKTLPADYPSEPISTMGPTEEVAGRDYMENEQKFEGPEYDAFKKYLDEQMTDEQKKAAGQLLKDDVALNRFMKELPIQTASGIGDVVNQTMELGLDIGDLAGVHLQVTDSEGNFDLRTITAEEAEAQQGTRGSIIPVAPPANTASARMVRSMTGFLVAYALPAMSLSKLGMVGTAAKGIAKTAIAGGVADMIMYDKDMVRISTLCAQVPALGALIPNYMADNNDGNEGIWEGRFKAAIEGLALTGAAEGLSKGLTTILRKSKLAKAARTTEEAGKQLSPDEAMERVRINEELKLQAEKDIVQPVSADGGIPRQAPEAFENVDALSKVLDDVLEDAPVKAIDDTVKAIDAPVKAIDDTVKAIDAPVKAIDAPVETVVDDTVKAIDAPVKAIDDTVKAVDDTVKAIDAPVETVVDDGVKAIDAPVKDVVDDAVGVRNAVDDVPEGMDAQAVKAENERVAASLKRRGDDNIIRAAYKSAADKSKADLYNLDNAFAKDVKNLKTPKTSIESDASRLLDEAKTSNVPLTEADKAKQAALKGIHTESRVITPEMQKADKAVFEALAGTDGTLSLELHDMEKIVRRDLAAQGLTPKEINKILPTKGVANSKKQLDKAFIKYLDTKTPDEILDIVVEDALSKPGIQNSIQKGVDAGLIKERLTDAYRSVLNGNKPYERRYIVNEQFAKDTKVRIASRIKNNPEIEAFLSPISKAADSVEAATSEAAKRKALKNLDRAIQNTRDEIFIGAERYRGAQLRAQGDKSWGTPSWGKKSANIPAADKVDVQGIRETSLSPEDASTYFRALDNFDRRALNEKALDMHRVAKDAVNKERAAFRAAKKSGKTEAELAKIETRLNQRIAHVNNVHEELRRELRELNSPPSFKVGAEYNKGKVSHGAFDDLEVLREKQSSFVKLDELSPEEAAKVKKQADIIQRIKTDFMDTYSYNRIQGSFKELEDVMGVVDGKNFVELVRPLHMNGMDISRLKSNLEFVTSRMKMVKSSKIGSVEARSIEEQIADAILESEDILTKYREKAVTPKPINDYYETTAKGERINIDQLDEADAARVNIEVDANGDVLKDKVTPGIRDSKGKLLDYEDAFDEDTIISAEELLTRNPDGSVYLNSNRINTTEDIERALRNSIEANKKALEGTDMSFDSMRAASKQEMHTVNKLLTRDADRPFTAGEAIAARETMIASTNNLVKLAKEAAKEFPTTADLYNFRKALALHNDLNAKVLRGRKATAQSLASWNISVGDAVGESADKIRGKAINDIVAGKEGDINYLAKAVLDLADKNIDELSKAASKLSTTKVQDAAYQVWINGLLSGPTTHIVNITSNIGTTLSVIPERYISEAYSHMMGIEGRGFRVANAQLSGLKEGLKEGFSLMMNKSKNDVLTSVSKLENKVQAISAEAFGVEAGTRLGSAIDFAGKAINFPGWALHKADVMFKGINYRIKLHTEATAKAVASGKTGDDYAKYLADLLSNPDDTLKGVANEFANIQTFTNEAGVWTKKFMGTVQEAQVGGFKFGRYICPFVRTPSNLLKWNLKRVPGINLLIDNEWALMKAGGAGRAEVLSRMSFGGTILAGASFLAADGLLTGGGPSDYKARKALELTGWRPYSAKFGDTYIDYSRLEGIGALFGYAADVMAISSMQSEDESGSMAAAGMAAFSKSFTDKTYISGLIKFMDAVNSGSPKKFEYYIQNQLGTLAPYSGAFKAIGRYTDPTLRDFRADPGTGIAGELRSLIKRAESNIPGLGSDAPPIRDLWGTERQYKNGMAAPAALLSPVAISKGNKDKVSKLVADTGVGYSMPDRAPKGVELFPAEYSRYCEVAGKKAKETLDVLERRGIFNSVTVKGKDSMATAIIRKVLTESRSYALSKLIRNGEFSAYRQRLETFIKEKEDRRMGTGEGNGLGMTTPTQTTVNPPARKMTLAERYEADWGKSPFDK